MASIRSRSTLPFPLEQPIVQPSVGPCRAVRETWHSNLNVGTCARNVHRMAVLKLPIDLCSLTLLGETEERLENWENMGMKQHKLAAFSLIPVYRAGLHSEVI